MPPRAGNGNRSTSSAPSTAASLDLGTGTNDIEEERRLLYVAMTRAKDDLTIGLPLRFYVTGQPKSGDRHVYAMRTASSRARSSTGSRQSLVAAAARHGGSPFPSRSTSRRGSRVVGIAAPSGGGATFPDATRPGNPRPVGPVR
ncbi:MAG: 3'-5' exonuclease [Paracoccaceae bacterium]